MPFNSQSYHRNKARKSALASLERARDAKHRAALGELQRWESDVKFHVTIARHSWRLYLSDLRLDRMNEDHRTMSAADFIAKYKEQ